MRKTGKTGCTNKTCPKKSKATGNLRRSPEKPLINSILSINEKGLNSLITEIVQRIRSYYGVGSGPSVRGTIAFKEVLQGFMDIQGNLTQTSIKKAALITLPHRLALNQGYTGSPSDIVMNIVNEVLYGFQTPEIQTSAIPDPTKDPSYMDDPMTPPRDVSDPNIPRKDMRDTMGEDRLDVIPEKDENGEPLQPSTQKGPLGDGRRTKFPLTSENIEYLCEELEQRRNSGECPEDKYDQMKTKFQEMLKASSMLQSGVSDREMSETVMEFMDIKDRKWSQDTSFRDIYIYYSIKGKEKDLMPPKRGYYGLRVLIDEMERQGMIECATTDEGHSLTPYALDLLIDHLLPGAPKGRRLNSIIGCGIKDQYLRDQGVQRYGRGDVFRNISTRHTLREIARKRKNMAHIDKSDIRVFIKKNYRNQSDIVFCIDTSGSMGFYRKLTYARIMAAGMAKAVLGRGDKIGITSFNDLGRAVLPLTDKKKSVFNYLVGLNARGSTNIGDGISCSTDLLLRESDLNKKYIVLITDGRSSAVSEKMFDRLDQSRHKDPTEEAAVFESRIASSHGVVVSVIHITDNEDSDVEFVNRIADAGNGRVQNIGSLEDIKDFMR